MNIIPEIFCPMIYKALTIQVNGEVTYCCDSTRTIPEPQKIEPEKVFMSKEFEADRELMARGAIPLGCAKCFKAEKRGLASKRVREVKRFKNGFYGPLKIQEGKVQPDLVYFSYRFGNLCNLKCIMCWSGASHKIALEEWGAKENTDIQRADKPRIKVNDLSLRDSDLKNLKWLNLSGGEPLLSKEFKSLLEFLLKKGKTEILISFNTNLTVLPDQIINLLKKFKWVQINVSIDGFGPSFEYVRHPANQRLVFKNFNYLMSETNIGLGVHFTVSALNLPSLPSLLKYLARMWNRNEALDFLAPILSMPEEQSLEVLDDDQLRVHQSEIEACMEIMELEPRIELNESLKNVSLCIDRILESRPSWGSPDFEKRSRLMKFLTAKDLLRGTDFRASLPHLNNL